MAEYTINKSSVRIPPQSLEAEMALLGSIMLRPEAMYEIMDTVSGSHFYADRHRIIFETMSELFSKSIPIDFLSLCSRLKEKSLLEQVGGNVFITELASLVPSSANIKHYADIVRKKYMMRKLIEASEHIAQMGFDESGDLEETLDAAEKKIFEITNQGAAHRFIELKDTLAEAWERIDRLHNGSDELRGIPTGFAELDNLTSGFQKSDLIILAARPSVGKTAFALDIARRAAVDHNVPVCVFSLEMSAQQLVDRMLAAQAQVDAWKLRTGKLSRDEDFQALADALDKLRNAPIFIDDQPGTNIIRMRSVARKLKSEKNLGLLIVDYLQLMLPTQSRNSDNIVQQVTEISRSLKNLARELDIPVLALSQLNRQVETRGGKPKLSDLRDSGSIEQDADIVMFIHREDRYKEESEKTNIAEILIEKHRNGMTGKIDLFFNDKKATFQPLDKNHMGGSEKDFHDF